MLKTKRIYLNPPSIFFRIPECSLLPNGGIVHFKPLLQEGVTLQSVWSVNVWESKPLLAVFGQRIIGAFAVLYFAWAVYDFFYVIRDDEVRLFWRTHHIRSWYCDGAFVRFAVIFCRRTVCFCALPYGVKIWIIIGLDWSREWHDHFVWRIEKVTNTNLRYVWKTIHTVNSPYLEKFLVLLELRFHFSLFYNKTESVWISIQHQFTHASCGTSPLVSKI